MARFYEFPSDMYLSTPAAEVLDDAPDTKYRNVAFIVDGTATALGISPGAASRERLFRMLHLCDHLDRTLDRPTAAEREEGRVVYQDAVSVFNPRYRDFPDIKDPTLDAWVEITNSSIMQLDPERRSEMYETLLQIGDVALHKAEVKTIASYIGVARVEGALVFDVLANAVSDVEARHRYFPTYRSCLRRFGEIAQISDSSNDLKQDYAEGLTQIFPHRLNAARLKWAAFALKTTFTLGELHMMSGIATAVERARPKMQY